MIEFMPFPSFLLISKLLSNPVTSVTLTESMIPWSGGQKHVSLRWLHFYALLETIVFGVQLLDEVKFLRRSDWMAKLRQFPGGDLASCRWVALTQSICDWQQLCHAYPELTSETITTVVLFTFSLSWAESEVIVCVYEPTNELDCIIL